MEGFMQNTPPVTHGEDAKHAFIIYNLCTIFMGRIYAKVEESIYLIIDYEPHHYLQVYMFINSVITPSHPSWQLK